jgi:cytochrome c-type biogenesis protein CcmH
MRRIALALALTLSLALAATQAPAAPVQRTSLTEIESEVMCPVCGTLLELAESPQALREKAFVTRLVVAGKTKDQIKDALVAEYGNEVLALPQGSGFSLSAYLVPVIAFVVAAVALGLGVMRWRREAARTEPGRAAAAGPSDEDAERLEADLARYDL